MKPVKYQGEWYVAEDGGNFRPDAQDAYPSRELALAEITRREKEEATFRAAREGSEILRSKIARARAIAGDWFIDANESLSFADRIEAAIAASEAEDHDGCLDDEEIEQLRGLCA